MSGRKGMLLRSALTRPAGPQGPGASKGSEVLAPKLVNGHSLLGGIGSSTVARFGQLRKKGRQP